MMHAVESAGAIAAITGVVRGCVALGLERAELDRFIAGSNVRKLSARDLGAAVAQGADGATTVAATLAISAMAGVAVMATGGIGGVHREVETTGSAVRDESADLLELAHTPMVVVCAGAKSILDLPSTWERLDTLGIPVVGYRTSEFPGFHVASTGIPLSVSADSAGDVAAIAAAHFALGRRQAVLVVQPPPADVALEADVVATAVESALQRARRENVRGAAVTPYLLAAIGRETGGRTIATNLGLLEANARLAGEVAKELVGR